MDRLIIYDDCLYNRSMPVVLCAFLLFCFTIWCHLTAMLVFKMIYPFVSVLLVLVCIYRVVDVAVFLHALCHLLMPGFLYCSAPCPVYARIKYALYVL